MDFLNAFLRTLSAETRQAIWYGSVVVLLTTLIAFSLRYSLKAGIPKKKAIIATLLFIATNIIMLLIEVGIEALTNGIIFQSGTVYFAPGMVFCALVDARYLKRSCLDSMDRLTVSYIIGRALQGLGCCMVGCCQGSPVPWGIYSAISKTTVVPMQAIESLLLLVTWCVLHNNYRKNNYKTNGKSVAMGMLLFGLINFITDIFTVTFPKIFFATSLEGISSFLTMCTGLVLLYIVDKNQHFKTN